MRRWIITPVAMSACFFSAAAPAQSSRVSRAIPGYDCMTLNITDAEAGDFHFHVPFYSQPSATAPVTGYASSQVAVRQPRHLVAGYTEALFPTGSPVWIKSDRLRLYHSNLDPTARCVPAMLSGGRIGFSYSHGPSNN